VYFGLIASDIYVSESRFVIRGPNKAPSTGLASLLKGTDFAGLSGGENFAVRDYVTSRDALRALNDKGQIAEIYSRPQIDPLNRLSSWHGALTNEEVFRYFSKKVSVEEESGSAITTLRVRAYTAKDVHWINERLLQLSESLVNRLNDRSRKDLVRYAERDVAEAKLRARDAALALSAYRNRERIIDPERQASVSLQMVSKLQDELIALRTQLIQFESFAPQNPQVPVLKKRIASLTHEIEQQVSGVAGGQGSLANSAVQYQRLSLENQFADRMLTGALASLELAQNDARRQQVYVERIVEPSQPDEAVEPKRLKGIFSTFILGLVAWGVLTMLLAALKEHQD
jgi:capsular polysaccharide transport system permease protein